ncbi:CRISPR-associated endonuclease Cas1 [Oceanivirga salmonicida]|uniref:CRISPR-associated endonuclease Cas1 n=1 Tax=Oceanivirga salmonicida TaxID=1769291 RepID=UPI0012E277EC|nr:CRISPR-associated endonuclease Cas1 [Oceanivirga salmonicida]
MELIVDTIGTRVRIKNRMIIVQNEYDYREFSPFKLDKIILSSKTSISGEVISSCKKNMIDLIFLDEYNYPCARLWNNKFGSISTIRRNQMEFFKMNMSYEFIKKWQIQKFNLYLKLIDSGIEKNKILKYISLIEKVDTNLSLREFRKEILKYESNASKMFFKAINKKLNEKYRVKKREKRNSKTKFNSMLNYSFGILYNYLEKEIIISGLDPSVGILHIDNYSKVPFVYDFIEKYRYFSYKSILNMLENENFCEEDFVLESDRILLGKNVRKQISIYFNIEIRKEKQNIKRYLSKISKFLLKEDYYELLNWL